MPGAVSGWGNPTMATDWEKKSLRADRHRRTLDFSWIKRWPQASIVYLQSRKPSSYWDASNEAGTSRLREVTLHLHSADIIPRESSKTNAKKLEIKLLQFYHIIQKKIDDLLQS